MQPLLSLVLLSYLFAGSWAELELEFEDWRRESSVLAGRERRDSEEEMLTYMSNGTFFHMGTKQVKELFYNMDLNHDGKLTRFDLQGLAEKGVINNKTAEKISWMWDANGDGIIKNCELTDTLYELQNVLLPKGKVIYAKDLSNFAAEKNFKDHDKDMDNVLTDKDFEIIDRTQTKKSWNFVKSYDINGDGILTLTEYLVETHFHLFLFYFKGQKRRVEDKLSGKEETELFNLLDSNSDGRATKYDIDELIRSGVISNFTGQRILREWDLNNNTIITKMELRKASLTLKATCHSGKMEKEYNRDFTYNEHLQWFKYLDKNFDNALTAADGNISFYIHLDVNGDGKISKCEYMDNKFFPSPIYFRLKRYPTETFAVKATSL